MFLPEILVDYFDLVKTEKQSGELHLYFEERNEAPETKGTVLSKGFYNEVILQDFPLRGQQVYLHIKRRRWTVKESNEIIKRDWSLVAKGTRMTAEFSAFLKVLSRY